MNQTQKRLSIIKLAISITDIETIQLQISKLRLLRADPQIQNIIDALESESYAQAQSLIQAYIDTPIQEVHQRVLDEKQEQTYTRKEQELIDQFDLFITENDNKEENELLDINDYLQASAAPPEEKRETSEVDFDKLLEMDEGEPKEPKMRIASHEDSMMSESEREEKETFSSTETMSGGTLLKKEKRREPFCDESLSEETIEDIATPPESENEIKAETAATPEKETTPSTTEGISGNTIDTQEPPINYRPIFSIKQQFQDAAKKYPLFTSSSLPFDSVEKWIEKISHEHGYTKTDVESTVINALKLAEETDDTPKAEAAELLLLSGLTEDEFGQLILARELFKGKLFEKNMPEAFHRIEQLAKAEYPEAICDLAQFYEHGIGTKKNKKNAKSLYKKAMHFGIKRAQKHYERLNKEGGLFSF